MLFFGNRLVHCESRSQGLLKLPEVAWSKISNPAAAIRLYSLAVRAVGPTPQLITEVVLASF